MDLLLKKLTCLAHLTLSSLHYLISRRGKCAISVIFYFVMKVSGGCEKEEMHHKSPPWENRVECTLVCAALTARWVNVLFTVCLRPPLCFLMWTTPVLQLAARGRRSVIYIFFSAFDWKLFWSLHSEILWKETDGGTCFYRLFMGLMSVRRVLFTTITITL